MLNGDLQPVYRVPRGSTLTTDMPQHMEKMLERTATDQQLVDIIVKAQGTEERLVVRWYYYYIYFIFFYIFFIFLYFFD